jgi:hypothetical protein
MSAEETQKLHELVASEYQHVGKDAEDKEKKKREDSEVSEVTKVY